MGGDTAPELVREALGLSAILRVSVAESGGTAEGELVGVAISYDGVQERLVDAEARIERVCVWLIVDAAEHDPDPAHGTLEDAVLDGDAPRERVGVGVRVGEHGIHRSQSAPSY